MKKLTVLIFAALVLGVLAAGSAFAQTRVILQGDIPFEFSVVGKTLPAGTYNVLNSSTYPMGFTIREAEKLESVYFVTFANEKSKHIAPKFVFRRYGNQYFLAEMWTGVPTGHELPKSSKELQVAKSYGEPQLIYIAAK